MLSNHLILCCPFPDCLPSFPASGSVPMSQLFARVAKVLELQFQYQSLQRKIRVDFLQYWLVWSPCSPRNSQETSTAPQLKSIYFSVVFLLYSPILSSIHDYSKNHSFNYMDICWQSNVSAFYYAVKVCHSFPSKEQMSFNFMAAITIHSEFGAQENKICTALTCSTSVWHE